MIVRAFLVTIIFAGLVGCSRSPKGKTEDFPDFRELEKKPAVAPAPPTPSLKNTATFHTVEIKQMKFVPEILHLHAGDTVLWVNHDITDHDITEEINKSWSSSKLPMGKSWQKVVHKSDDYFCSIHVVMKGKLVIN